MTQRLTPNLNPQRPATGTGREPELSPLSSYPNPGGEKGTILTVH